jgi:glycosyltransferase involved in cell wall biosynthesis
MPQGVSYWTGRWEAHDEAISTVVAVLRDALAPSAPVVSSVMGQELSWRVTNGVVRLSGRYSLALRALAAIQERRFALTHVVFGMNASHLLRALGRRPILFTVVTPGNVLPRALLGKVTMFVAETAALASELRANGVAIERIRVIPPGVDLNRFRPVARPVRPFTVLCANSPTSAHDLSARGIPLLIEAARLCPDVNFTILWRTSGDRAALERAIAALNPPSNVLNLRDDVRDMSRMYQQADAVAMLTAAGHGTSCPSSVVEALASGCPVVVSKSCALADVVGRAGAGLAVVREPHAIAHALNTLQAEHAARAAAARALAVECFDVDRFVSSYRRLYEELGVGARIAARARALKGSGALAHME